MKPTMPRGAGIFVALLYVCTRLTAANAATIHGIVTDNSGKPIRGAMITATKGNELVAKFSQADGRYALRLVSGTYNLEIRIFGYAPKRLTQVVTLDSEANVSLTPSFQVNQLSSAEVEQLLPDNQDTRLIKSECIRCHGLSNPARGGNMSASTWQSFLPRMTDKRHWDNPYASGDPKGSEPPAADYKDRLSALSQALEKYFGPDSPNFSPNADPPTIDQIKHLPPTDDVLKSTIHEFDIPTHDVGAHSIITDATGNAWFSEIQPSGNKIGKFNLQTKKFTEYPLPIHDARPDTGVIGKDGLVWIPLTAQQIHAKLASLDPRTGKMTTYDFPGNNVRPHTAAIDQEGNIWMSGGGLLTFNVKTHQFKQYELPIPTGTEYGVNTWQAWHNLPNKPPLPLDQAVYDVKVDSKGMVWCSNKAIGILIRLDPKTGETKIFVPPGTSGIKGIEIDSDDNVWFAEFWGNAIGKFDQKTESFSTYKPPTPFAMPYGLTVDKKSGRIWFSDLNGNFLTRFDPKTEKFDEFPIPSPQASAHFPAFDNVGGRVWFTDAFQDKIGYIDVDSATK